MEPGASNIQCVTVGETDRKMCEKAEKILAVELVNAERSHGCKEMGGEMEFKSVRGQLNAVVRC